MWAFLTHPCVVLVLGGGLGTNARYWLGEYFKLRGWSASFPWHTFVINVLGSFLLGVLVVACRHQPGRLLLLGTGFCGGFTTFSTFSLEAVKLLEDGRNAAAAGYVFGSVAAGLVGAWAGVQAAK